MVLRIIFLWLQNQQGKEERCKTQWPIPLWIRSWDSCHVCSNWLPVEPFHRFACFPCYLPLPQPHCNEELYGNASTGQRHADNPTSQRPRGSMHRYRQLTQNALEVHISLVLTSEAKTCSARTQVIYMALIKNALILDTQKAVPICTFTKHMAWQRQLCMMLHHTKVLYWS